MELFKKITLLSALLLSAASNASAFVPRANKLSTCSAPTFGSVTPSHMQEGLLMSAVAEETDAATGSKTIDNIRLVSQGKENLSKEMRKIRLKRA